MVHWRKLFLFLLIVYSIQLVYSEEVTIIDTRNATSDLGWFTTPGGWTEVTSTDETDADLRTFEVCKIRSAGQDNWLRTPYLNVKGVERIFIEIRFTIRSCRGIKNLVSCKETFNLYYLPSRDPNDVNASVMKDITYTKLDTIAAGARFDSSTMNSNIETRIISSLSTDGLFLAFQDTGACMSIIYVRIYYKACAEMVTNLAVFPGTNTGPETTSLVDVEGKCVENSNLPKFASAPSQYCNVDGKWLVPSGGCQCLAGYQPNTIMTECNECPIGKFKSTSGNHLCSTCPRNSYALTYRSTTCKCTSGYFRAQGDQMDSSCSRSPGAPAFPKAVLSNSSIVITWSEPRDDGGRSDLTYSVSCERCNTPYLRCSSCNDDVIFVPRRSQLTTTKVSVRDIVPNTSYRFKISSLNGVSQISGSQPNWAEIFVKTNREVPSVVPFVRIVSTNEASAMLRWSEPPYSGLHIIEYQIQYIKTDDEVFTFKTKQLSYQLRNLEPHATYSVQVRARNGAGYGPFSRPTAFITKNSQTPSINGDDNLAHSDDNKENKDESLGGASETRPPEQTDHLVLGVIVSCSLAIIVLVALVLWFKRRKRLMKSKAMMKYPTYDTSTAELLSPRAYVDPSTYEDPYRAVGQFAKEIDRKFIKIERTIGSGEFGEVSKGSMEFKPRKREVAIKTLKNGSSGEQQRDFLNEALIMGQFDHPNVIRLEGVVTKSRPLMIITEYMDNGSLDKFLKNNKNNILLDQLTKMLQDIAMGMKYLSKIGYVHRDLAARNVLVNSEYECKISDFGLSRSFGKMVDEEMTTCTFKGGVVPVRWSPPEALNNQYFSSFSDVWSFGILTWEVLSNGERPYWEMSNADVTYFVECGYRLPAPCFCPRLFHELMLECWNKEHTSRPSFSHLVSLLEHFQQNPTCLEDLINQRPFRDQEDCIPEMMDLSSLSHWLEEIHLLSYKPNMLRHGCVTAEQIMQLTKEELNDMEITNRNDVNTFLQEAEILRYKIEEVNKIGVAV